MKVTVDDRSCVAAGSCVLAAPEVFDQRDDDGVVVLLDGAPPPRLRDGVADAVAMCPAAAITLEDPP